MQYYAKNEAAVAGEAAALDKQAAEWGNDSPMLYLYTGSTLVRILPPFSAAGVFFRKITKHRTRALNRTHIVACPAVEEGTHCPICVKGQEYVDSRDEAKIKFADENFKPKAQYLYNVLCHFVQDKS